MLKNYRPTSPGRRQLIKTKNAQLAKNKPEKKLVVSHLRRQGRSGASGRITTRHKGGGHKKLYRVVDFKQDKFNIPAKVLTLEYDPFRNCFINLIVFKDGEKRYVIAANGLAVGDEIIFGEKVPVKAGNRLFLRNIPVGTPIFGIELYPGSGAILVRGAGSSAQVLAVEGGYAQIKMPSGEIRLVKDNCFATVGQVSNSEFSAQVTSKAGRSRWLGIRPTVRGSVMNPCDHPHGGGEGRAPIGLRRGPKTPWGKQAFGVRTRRRRKSGNRLILQRRK